MEAAAASLACAPVGEQNVCDKRRWRASIRCSTTTNLRYVFLSLRRRLRGVLRDDAWRVAKISTGGGTRAVSAAVFARFCQRASKALVEGIMLALHSKVRGCRVMQCSSL